MILLSIDPGLRACGVAAWDETGALIVAELVSSAQDGLNLPDVVRETTRAVEQRVKPFCNEPLTCVIERPQTYGGRAAVGDANDLIDLGILVGSLANALCAAELPRPFDWKRNIPKKTKDGTNIVAERCAEELSAAELARVRLPSARGLHHNVWDAVGIGLWWLKKRGLR